MSPERYIKLYEKYLSGSCTPEEEAMLMNYQDNFKPQGSSQQLSDEQRVAKSEIYNEITKAIDKQKIKPLWSRFWWAAATVLVTVGAVGLFLIHTPKKLHDDSTASANRLKPIKPGTTTAVLTLANGSKIVLDSVKNGVLANSGNTTIKKQNNGLITYQNTKDAGAPSNPNALNSIIIPRGGRYAVTLPDGTSVWLNSKSSLTYPVAFTGSERKVTLSGEAYFEVAKNKTHPFIVHTAQADVRVLGTHFNINAYDDENGMKATLLEGSVQLSHNSLAVMLVPGQQGIVTVGDQHIQTKNVNVDNVVAWKNGYFIFKGQKIGDVMRQISRWYDVDVEYKGNMPDETIGGMYSQNKDIKELLDGLEFTGLVHFKIEGRRIIVMK